MLINALHEEQCRVAIVEDGKLQELDIESAIRAQTKSNIYKGTITKVEASLQASFVEYGASRQGFLPINEIHSDYWKEDVPKGTDPRKLNIHDVVNSKQTILLQVVKEERGNKGAAITTFISLAGRYLVLNPNDPRGGISRKLGEKDRRAMKQLLAKLEVPDNMGLIVRTAGKNQTLEALQRDFSFLCKLWDEIRIKSESAPSPALIYVDGDLATRAIRDHFTIDISDIWVDDHALYQRTKQFVHAVLPGREKQVKLYRGKKPLFRHHGIEEQCEEIHERQIRLPSGGSIVFDTTEALTSIDINSSRATGEKNIDDTALATNLEAAKEIARQLRIRDIGGLIVIDFIDMVSRKHGQQVEEYLREFCKPDKARIQVTRISRFGLLEMSRQRLHMSIRESTTEVCPRCQGRGRVRNIESMALHMLTRMEDHAAAGKKPVLAVQLPAETGEYLMNNKRSHLARIESLYDVQINLQVKAELVIPHFRIERQWTDGKQQRIEVLEDTSKNIRPAKAGRRLKPMEPIVSMPSSTEEESAETASSSAVGSLFGKLWSTLSGKNKKASEPEVIPPTATETPEEPRPRRRRSRSRRPRSRATGNRKGPTAGKETVSKESAIKEGPQTPVEEQKEAASVIKESGEETPKGDQPESQPQRSPRPRRRPRRRPRSSAAPTGETKTAQPDSNAANSTQQTPTPGDG